MENVVICGAARTPMGGFQGCFSDQTAADLGGVAISAAVKQAGADAAQVNELLMGCVLPAGQGQAPARQAGFKAGLGQEVPATTLNKMCGSGMKAAMIAYDQLALGGSDMIVAGGMESMTNAPYLMPQMRGGARIGHGQVIDHMFLDGLEDAYDKGRLMGSFAEDCAEKFQLSRAAQDDYALASLDRAQTAQKSGAFADEIAAVTLATRKGEAVVGEDDQFLLDLGRGGGASHGARGCSDGTGAADPRPHPGPCQPRTGARLVHHCACPRRREIAETARLACRGCRPLGG